MRWSDIWIAGTGACLPDRVSVGTAIAENLYDREAAEGSRYTGIAVAEPDRSAVDLAVAAARTALERSGHRKEDVGTLLHAVVLHSGLDVWNAAAYIQREVLTARCLPTELRGGCNGLVALEWACAHLSTHPGQPAALVTTADCFQPVSLIDRWRADSAVVYADGGTSLLLSREQGFARLLSLTTVAVPELEPMHRGADSLSPGSADTHPVDLARRVRAFFTDGAMSVDEFWGRQEGLVRETVGRVTAEAGVDLGRIEHVVAPFVGHDAVQRLFVDTLGVEASRLGQDFARSTGHLGAGDPFAGLNHLVETERLAPGERVLLVSQGVGLVMTAALVEVTEVPADRR